MPVAALTTAWLVATIEGQAGRLRRQVTAVGKRKGGTAGRAIGDNAHGMPFSGRFHAGIVGRIGQQGIAE